MSDDRQQKRSMVDDRAGKEYVKSCVDSVLRQSAATEGKPSGKSPAAGALEHHTADAFNKTAVRFLANMQKIFPDDMVIRQAKSEVESLSNGKRGIFSASLLPDVKDARLVPSRLFAQQISRVVSVSDTEQKTVSSVMLDKDERLLQHCDQIHLLSALGLPAKYAKLNAKNRDYVWKTLATLVMCASSVEMVEHDDLREVDELIGAVLKKSKSVAAKSGGRLDVKKAAQMVADDAAVRDVSKRLVVHAAEGDSNAEGAHLDDGRSERESESIDAAALSSYIQEVTGKVVDVTGLADAGGKVDLSEEGMKRIVNVLGAHGAGSAGSGVRKGTAKEAALRDRLRARLEAQRAEKEESGAAATATADPQPQPQPQPPQTKKAIEREVEKIMKDMSL